MLRSGSIPGQAWNGFSFFKDDGRPRLRILLVEDDATTFSSTSLTSSTSPPPSPLPPPLPHRGHPRLRLRLLLDPCAQVTEGQSASLPFGACSSCFEHRCRGSSLVFTAAGDDAICRRRLLRRVRATVPRQGKLTESTLRPCDCRCRRHQKVSECEVLSVSFVTSSCHGAMSACCAAMEHSLGMLAGGIAVP